jgi:hypothetical protein
MAGSALGFLALLAFEWVVSLVFHLLDGIYGFPPEIHRAATGTEIAWFYCDIFLSSVVLLVGIIRFCRKILESE